MIQHQLNLDFTDMVIDSTRPKPSSDRLKVLIVEDDFSMQPIWERIVHTVNPRAVVRWAHSEEGAEVLIEDYAREGHPFDLVVTDIFLEGKKNGVDLWKKYGGDETLFLFTSGVTPDEFAKMLGEYENQYPVLLQKPVRPRESVDSIRMLLTCRDFFTPALLPRGSANRSFN